VKEVCYSGKILTVRFDQPAIAQYLKNLCPDLFFTDLNPIKKIGTPFALVKVNEFFG